MIQHLSLYLKRLTGIYRWEEVHKCPACDEYEFVPYSEHRYGFQTIRLQSCLSCKLVIQNPRLNEESLNRFYKSDYRNGLIIRFDSDHSEKLFQRGYRRGAYICKFLDENNVNYNRAEIIEIGCSYGGILEQFRNQGCQVTGCDVSTAAVQYGVSKGLDLKAGSIDTLSGLNLKADLIILSHVIEHIVNPGTFLKTVREMLKPDGILYMEVPGIDNPKIKAKQNAAQPGHLLYFNLTTVSNLLEKSGFQLIAGNEIVQSIFKTT